MGIYCEFFFKIMTSICRFLAALWILNGILDLDEVKLDKKIANMTFRSRKKPALF